MKQKSYMAEGSGKNPAQTYYEDDKGSYTIVNVKDWWDDIGMLATSSHERANYPTQKPEALLERIIIASSNPGDLVADFFMGSGTTQAVAMKLGRRFIGADINLGAIQTTTKRLLNISKDLQEKRELSKQQELYTVADRVPDYGNTPAYYTGFSSFNVNNYDVFKNPVQAKELLIEALEIQKLPGNNLFDGEKDGRMIKIMPVNRIATRVDLNQLISNLDYKSFEKRKAEQPNKPVEHITLVCMGHELDLQASFSEQVPYDVDIDIVDILRDRKDLQFRHEAEAEIMIENGFLVIKSFYPMNLLQKLSMEKENVEDWREMVESIMIDFNYDGSIFEPKEVDIPEKNVLVTGKYSIPDDAGRIRIKITDVLSESFEKDVQ
jgi:site-specific DNA-methyltransferase (adenine-specific)/adenine-specific DNA-methyltransferase